MTRAATATRRRGVVAIAAILVACVIAGTARAQTPQPAPGVPGAATEVAITVVDLGGRLLPFEQFRAEVHAECAPDGGTPLPHLHTRAGGPAIAVDLSAVADPAPAGCGFGTIAAGNPASLVVRLANVPAGAVRAWSARTGIEVTSVAAAVPPDALVPLPAVTPTATPPVASDAPSVRTGSTWSLLVMPLLLLAGVVAGYLLARRGGDRPVRVPERIDDYAPAGDGTLRDRLTRGHAGLLALPPERLPHEPVATPMAAVQDVPASPVTHEPAASLDGADAPPEAGPSTEQRTDAGRD